MADGLTRDEVLGELELLATVEHALVVEYLSVSCALGHDLDADQGGPPTEEGRNAAAAASSLALSAMFRLKDLNFALIDAGREAQLERATSITGDSGTAVALEPPSAAQLELLLEREKEIANAVDERYARLVPAVTTDPVFEGDLLDRLKRIIAEDGSAHASSAVVALRDALGDLAPADALVVTRRETDDTFEQRLLDISDRAYGLVVGALRARFVPDVFSSATLAVSAMTALDEVNRALVQRGLLPPFSPA